MAWSAARPKKTKPRAQSRSGQFTIPYEPSERTPRYHPSASANAEKPAARSPAKGGLPAVENTTRHRKRSATSNSGQERTARAAHERDVPACATTLSRKKYQIMIPTESMMLKESRKVMRVICFIVRPIRSNRAQISKR